MSIRVLSFFISFMPVDGPNAAQRTEPGDPLTVTFSAISHSRRSSSGY